MRVRHRHFTRYGIAVASIVLATLARMWLHPVLGALLPFYTYIVAVILVAWYGGLGPSVVALILGAVAAAHFFIPPDHTLMLHRAPDLFEMGLYLFVGTVCAVLSESIRASKRVAEANAVEAMTHRDRLRVTLKSIGDAVVAADTGGRVTFLNPVAESLTGWSQAEAVGRPLEDVVDVTESRGGRPIGVLASRVLREGEVSRLEPGALLHTRGGASRPIEDVMTPICDSRVGEVVGVVLAFRDVTERRRAEETLLVSEDRLRMAIDSADLGTFDYDPASGSIVLSDRCRAMFGLPPGDAVDYAMFLRTLHPEDREATDRAIHACLVPAAGGEFLGEYRTVGLSDGAERWVSARGRVHFDGDGRAVRFVGTTQDVTERKRSEEAYRRSEARLRRLTDANIIGVIVGEHSVITEANEVFLNLVGATRDDLAAARLRWWESSPPELRHLDERALEECMSTGVAAPYETEYLGRDGRRVPILTGVASLDEAGSQWVAFVLDVTERKRLEAELHRRIEALKEADRRKDEFLATLSHELRNPLAPVRNAVAVMRSRPTDDPELHWARDVIDRQIRQMTRLVDDLLDVSRITVGKVQLRKEVVLVGDVVRRAVETVRPLFEEQRHELRVALPPEPVYLDADAARLEQVLENLLNNAAKYTEPGGRIGVSVGVEAGEALIRVWDNGIGMPADLLPAVFDLFTQAERTLDRAQGGLGIGLTLVRRLVEMHGGRVSARSDGLGQGSEFLIRLPASDTGAVSKPGEGQGGGPTTAARPATRHRIVVVDDSVDHARSLSKLLTLWKHEVRTAHDGPTALDVAAEFRPDLILCDIGLPGMNGFEVARRVRERCGPSRPVLVAVSGYGQEEDRRRSRDAGFDRHVTEPVDPDALRELLSHLLSTVGADDPSGAPTEGT